MEYLIELTLSNDWNYIARNVKGGVLSVWFTWKLRAKSDYLL